MENMQAVMAVFGERLIADASDFVVNDRTLDHTATNDAR